MSSSHRINRRRFVSTAAAAVGASLLPSGSLRAAMPQDPAIDAMATHDESRKRERVGWKGEPFPLAQVRLLESPFKRQMEINNQWVLSFPSDRLLHTFRITAGLPSSAEPLGGWEKPDCELRGHFTGHYLSACALAYGATGEDSFKHRGDEMVAELSKCQDKLGNGYLSAYPDTFYDRLRDGKPVWAPFYTYHKILAGHLDMYSYCGNQQALDVAEKMAGWVGHWCEGLSDAQMQRILNVEHGGMLESLYNLYALTGNGRYRYIGNHFTHRDVFDPLADHRDELKGLHANTNIPKMTGVARRYELTGDERDRNIAQFFWDTVTSERCYSTGGTSNHEHWEDDPGILSKHLGLQAEEDCCSYNMLKLTRHIFGWTADPRAMDYYERTLWNTRIGTQDGKGRKGYFLSLGNGYWRYYNSDLASFWCCTGTGIEEFAKFADSIYFHDDDGVYVNLFIASELNWPEKGIHLRQETSFPEKDTTTLMLRTAHPMRLALNIRVPYWATKGGTVKVNGESLPVFSSPSSYLTLKRIWKDGDKVEVAMPMSLHIDATPDDPTLQTAMYGPLVLAGRLGSGGMPEDLTVSGRGTVPKQTTISVPDIKNDSKDPLAWVEPVAGSPLAFRTAGQSASTDLIPLYKVMGERYVVYWKVQGPNPVA